jgi:hypothetical protein
MSQKIAMAKKTGNKLSSSEGQDRPSTPKKKRKDPMIIPASTAIQHTSKAFKGKAAKASSKEVRHSMDTSNPRRPAKSALPTQKPARLQVKGGKSKTDDGNNWNSKYPDILKAFEDAPAGKVTETVCAVLDTLEPAPTHLQALRLLEDAGIPAHARGDIWMRYKDPEYKAHQAAQEADTARRLARDAAKAGEKSEAREVLDKLHKAKAEGKDLLEAVAGPDPLKLIASHAQTQTEALSSMLADQYLWDIQKSSGEKTMHQKAMEEYEKKTKGLSYDKNEDVEVINEVWGGTVKFPFINRIQRAKKLAEAKYHGVPELEAEAVAREIILSGYIEPGAFCLNVLRDYLKEADIDMVDCLYIGIKLAEFGFGKSDAWKVEYLNQGHDLGSVGFKAEFAACMLAAIRPLPTEEVAMELLRKAGLPQDVSEPILTAFSEVRPDFINKGL